jgi:hypothetical protein
MKSIETKSGHIILVDDEDFAEVSRLSWYARRCNTDDALYAARTKRNNGRTITIYMHRLLTQCPVDCQVDHQNHNGLDNRRENLLVCSKPENLKNRKWRKRICRRLP